MRVIVLGDRFEPVAEKRGGRLREGQQMVYVTTRNVSGLTKLTLNRRHARGAYHCLSAASDGVCVLQQTHDVRGQIVRVEL